MNAPNTSEMVCHGMQARMYVSSWPDILNERGAVQPGDIGGAMQNVVGVMQRVEGYLAMQKSDYEGAETPADVSLDAARFMDSLQGLLNGDDDIDLDEFMESDSDESGGEMGDGVNDGGKLCMRVAESKRRSNADVGSLTTLVQGTTR